MAWNLRGRAQGLGGLICIWPLAPFPTPLLYSPLAPSSLRFNLRLCIPDYAYLFGLEFTDNLSSAFQIVVAQPPVEC